MIDLIYCAGGNTLLTQRAHEAGWALGVRSDKWHHPLQLTFVDVNYKKADFEKHLRRVAREQPKYATVPDLSDKEFSHADIERTLNQAARLKDYCEIVLVVPKLSEQLDHLPNGLVIAYSIPTKYGGAKFSPYNPKLAGRRLHLLGGSPHNQLRIAAYHKRLPANQVAKIISVDCNMHQKLAVNLCQYWQVGGREGGQWLKWSVIGTDQYYSAFEKSCRNIKAAWERLEQCLIG